MNDSPEKAYNDGADGKHYSGKYSHEYENGKYIKENIERSRDLISQAGNVSPQNESIEGSGAFFLLVLVLASLSPIILTPYLLFKFLNNFILNNFFSYQIVFMNITIAMTPALVYLFFKLFNCINLFSSGVILSIYYYLFIFLLPKTVSDFTGIYKISDFGLFIYIIPAIGFAVGFISNKFIKKFFNWRELKKNKLTYKGKSYFISMLLSIFYPGLGDLYCNRWSVYIIFQLFLIGMTYLTVLIELYGESFTRGIIIMIPEIFLYFAIWVAGLFSAWNGTKISRENFTINKINKSTCT